MSLACVGSACSVLATLCLPPLMGVCFSLYTAQAPACPRALHCVRFQFSGILQKSGPAFCAFPSPSSSGNQELDERTLPECSASYPVQGPSLSFCAPWQGTCAWYQSWPLAATLPEDVDHPESQEVFGQKLKACFQFGRGSHLWG